MATKPKRPPKYDLKAADRKRNLAVQIGLTAVVIIFAVGLVAYIIKSNEKKPTADTQAVRISSSSLIKNEAGDPKAVLSLYEDFQCPHCRDFEAMFGPTITKLIDSGAVAADYNMVAILDSPVNQNYSTRGANAAYCVADENKDAFRRFHAALYAQQPPEGAPGAPDNKQLIEVARQAGVVGGVPDCVNSGKYDDMVDGLAKASKITSTPTIRINGEDWDLTSPEDLVTKVKSIVGDVPGINPS